MNELLIEQRMEKIYLDADNTLTYGSFLNFAIAVTFGLFYNNLLLSLGGGSALLGIFLLIKEFVHYRPLRSSLLSSIFLLWVALYIITSGGLLETRYLYFAYVFFIVIYQNQKPVIVTTLVGLSFVITYFLTILLETPLANFMSTYLLEPQNVSYERFFVSIFTIAIGAISNIWIVRTLREKTINNIINSINQEEQLRIFDRNKKFADEIAQGNLQASFEEDENDQLGKSLNTMRKGLAEAFNKQNQDRFMNVGIAEVSEILRTHLNDLDVLSNEIISKLVKYMKANQGAIFIVQEDEHEEYLELRACYAYNRKKYLNKRIGKREGLLGQAYMEKDVIYMTDIPENYITITSGLGEALPRCLIIVPLVVNGQVAGVIELASFNTFSKHEINFLKKAAESISSTIVAAKVNIRTQILLEKANQMAERMHQQEISMRQNVEEIRAIQESQARDKKITQYQHKIREKEKELKGLELL
jgi:methyl-accepting chemotaxis protein